MPRFDPTDFSRLLARLTPQELRKVEGMVAEARERAEAVLEIDARAEAGGPACYFGSCRCSSVSSSPSDFMASAIRWFTVSSK